MSEPVVTAAFSSTVSNRLAVPLPNPPERPNPFTARHLQLPGSLQIVSYESIPFLASVTAGQASEVKFEAVILPEIVPLSVFVAAILTDLPSTKLSRATVTANA